MKNKQRYITVLFSFLLFLSCGETDTGTTEAPSCNAKLISLSTQASTISSSTSSVFQSVSYQVSPNFSVSNFTTNTLTNSILPSSWNYFFMEQTRNGVSNEFALRYSNHLVKYNKSSNNLSIQTINPNLVKPFYHNGNLRFLKFTNIDNTGSYSYDPTGPTYVKRYDVQIFDENDIAITPLFTINLNEDDGNYKNGNDAPIVSGNIVYYLGAAHIIAIDLSSNWAIKKNLFPYHYYNNPVSASGLVDSGGYLRLLKHFLDSGTSKIELINLTKSDVISTTASVLNYTTIFKMQEAIYSGAVLTNAEIGHLTNNVDKNIECMNYCGTKYYIVDLVNGTSGNDSKIYELILDGTTNYKVNVFTVPDTRFVLFDIEN